MTQPTDHDAPDAGEPTNTAARKALTVDWARYEKLLEDSDIPDSEKREFIETLWQVVVAFVDLGFGLHPLQQATGHDPDPDSLLSCIAAEMLDCEQRKTKAQRSNTTTDETAQSS